MDGLDEDMVRRAAAGVPDALSSVYSILSPKVVGYLRARGSEDPEGLTNDVFLQVIPKLRGLKGGVEGLRTFVFSVAHARVVDEHRRRARRPRMSTYDADTDLRRSQSAEGEFLETGTAHLDHALSCLGEDQRTVLLMRTVADLSLEETANALGKSTGAVKQLQRRALVAMREMYLRGEVAT